MFKNIKSKLGQVVTEDSIQGEIYPESFDSGVLDSDPEMVLNDPASSFELKKQALQKIKDRYLKPKENENE